MQSRKADHIFRTSPGNNHCYASTFSTGDHPWCIGDGGGCGNCNTPGCSQYREHLVNPARVTIKESPESFHPGAIRKFETGATRSAGIKPDYSGYLSPSVIKRYGEYMLKHQTQADGTTRSSSNWKLGIPLDSYKESLIRHTIDYWYAYETGAPVEVLEELACAMLFNVQGSLHALLQRSLDSSTKTK